MKKYTLVAGIIELAIKEKIEKPIEIRPNTFLTNNPSIVRKYLKQHDLMALGTLECNLIFSGAPVVFRECEVKDIKGSHIALVDFLRDIHAFLTSIWLLSDNSANIELGFAISQKKPHVHSNSLTFHYSSANGENAVSQFPIADIVKASEICMGNFAGVRSKDELGLTMLQKQTGRINAANSFLQQARAANDLGIKVANYCSYFESLLSTTTTELSHQLAERAAFFLRNSPEERFNHYKLTKQAYTIRSKVVHGDVLSKRQLDTLQEISKHCDQLARELLLNIINNSEYKEALENSKSEELDSFLVKKVFGISS